MNITGNTIFIPGATSGIGLGLALRFHELGNTVIVGGRRTEHLKQITKDVPGIYAVEIDTTDAPSVARATAEVLSAHPEVNVLIPMAGIMLPEDVHTPDHLDVAERTIATNLLGPIRLIASFIPHLATRDDAVIMTVSSGLAFVPLPLTPTYNATKAAIHSYTESLRVQLSDTAVQVMELVPPAVRTTLMNQENAENAMPLDAYLTEVMGLLESAPDAQEIVVKNAMFFRNAVAEGRYDQVLGVLSGH